MARTDAPQWAALEMENEPEDAELSPIYDFNTRRDHWREWRKFSKRNSAHWAQILVWIVLAILSITFLCLYISERYSNSTKANDHQEDIPFERSASSLFFSETGYNFVKEFKLDVDYRGINRTQIASKGMVASDHGDCSDVGGDILKKGGNAMDAAVTTALCIGIRNPFASGMGGGAFILVRTKDGGSTVIDAREVAPGAASQDMFSGHSIVDSITGGLAIAVPLEMKGLEMLWEKHGVLEWKELIEPVIPLARDGFRANPALLEYLVRGSQRNKATMVTDALKEIFFIADNGVWRLPNVGEMCCKRPALAKTLELVAKNGVEATHKSSWGDDLIADIQNFPYPGIIQKKDLVRIKPIVKEPIKARVFGMDVVTVPPPSSSATLIMALKLMESYKDRTNITLNYHRLLETMKHMLAVRSHFEDVDLENNSNQGSVENDILSPSFIDDLREITTDKSVQQDVFAYGGKYNIVDKDLLDEGTSHICTADSKGNVVSMTTSVNWSFGSQMISEKTGLLLNNHMNDFTIIGVLNHSGPIRSTASFPNLIIPGRKPRSSMSPLIFTKNGKLKLAIGASGGRRILMALLQVLYDHFGREVDLKEAIDTGRIYCSLSGPGPVEDLHIGPITFNTPIEILKALEQLGHEVVIGSQTSSVAALEALEDGMFRGFVDPRKDGASSSNL